MKFMNFVGLIIGISTFLIIGLFHPIVIKLEYHFGVKSWIIFPIVGTAALVASLLIDNVIASSLLGVLAFSSYWSILEIFEQEKRVKKGWFPKNPKRNDYKF
ncbi:MAG: DUF4491 family protein [Paludibacteraceae bacterium]|nr:DUF4491 family protein [Paludibacteraceae bacterium]MBO5863611.1 DUF4491 family protein [Paludibacteraceae bacterium]MBO5988166.1 DUF4491 family protein [Paludibacteraceae bacterium]MBQ1970616.1 DUF4491 family protein [Paludibacteraceae bacterium]